MYTKDCLILYDAEVEDFVRENRKTFESAECAFRLIPAIAVTNSITPKAGVIVVVC